jgi:hypothetical protein
MRRSMSSASLAMLTVSLIVALLAWRKAEPSKASPRWQYYKWTPGRNWEARLDSLGAEGWELVAVTSYQGMSTDMYFKRPVP